MLNLQQIINTIFELSTHYDTEQENAVKLKFDNVTFFDGTDTDYLPSNYDFHDIIYTDYNVYTSTGLVEHDKVDYDAINVMYVHNRRGGFETVGIVFTKNNVPAYITYASDNGEVQQLEYDCNSYDLELNLDD